MILTGTLELWLHADKQHGRGVKENTFTEMLSGPKTTTKILDVWPLPSDTKTLSYTSWWVPRLPSNTCMNAIDGDLLTVIMNRKNDYSMENFFHCLFEHPMVNLLFKCNHQENNNYYYSKRKEYNFFPGNISVWSGLNNKIRDGWNPYSNFNLRFFFLFFS